jgi:hypothetical protein
MFASGSCTSRGMNKHLHWKHQRGDLSMTRPRPLRFGVSVAQARSKQEWVATARKIESLDYSTLLMPDHLGQQLAPIAALQAAAEATQTLRIGSLVFANDFRLCWLRGTSVHKIERLLLKHLSCLPHSFTNHAISREIENRQAWPQPPCLEISRQASSDIACSTRSWNENG